MTDDETAAELFGSLFVLMQRITRLADAELASLGLTSRQWLLLAVVTKAFPGSPPTLSEAAAAYGTSRQNVKQVAEQLQREGWLRLVVDPRDGRATQLLLTDKVSVFAEADVAQRQTAALRAMFAALSPAEQRALLSLVRRCLPTVATPPAPATSPNRRDP